MIKFSNTHNFQFPYLFDQNQETAKNYNAVCTPDFFCFDNQNQLFYRGRLDNLKYQSKDDKLRKKDLVDAFKLKINNGAIVKNQISSMGCSKKWKKNV